MESSYGRAQSVSDCYLLLAAHLMGGYAIALGSICGKTDEKTH